jgi:hypothetical protein
VPLPVPLAPLVIVIQEPDRVAVHEQPLATVTATLPVLLDGLKPWLVGLTVKTHEPFWVTVKVSEPMLIEAERAADELLAAML